MVYGVFDGSEYSREQELGHSRENLGDKNVERITDSGSLARAVLGAVDKGFLRN